MSYDSILKFLIEEYTKPILSWLFEIPTDESVTILKTELNVEPIRADGVFFLQVGNKIIHLEFQTTPKSDPPVPIRMLDYWIRLYRSEKLYQSQNREIEQVVIFLKPTNSPLVFEDTFQVGKTIHRYRVIRIWECDPTPLLSQPELLPLAVLAKSEQPSQLLSQVAGEIAKIEDKRKQSNIAACVELLAGINYSEELIAMYLQEDILRESVIYQKIINEGIERGEKTEAIALVKRLIKKRFENLTENMESQIETLTIEQLESLGENLFDFNSVEDISLWLNQVLRF